MAENMDGQDSSKPDGSDSCCRRNTIKWLAGLIGAVTLPFLITTTYMHSWRISSGGGADLFVLVAALLAGALCMIGLPLDRWSRVGTVLVYLVVMFGVQVVYVVNYVCDRFGACF